MRCFMLFCVRGTVYIILVTQLEALPPQPSLAPVEHYYPSLAACLGNDSQRLRLYSRGWGVARCHRFSTGFQDAGVTCTFAFWSMKSATANQLDDYFNTQEAIETDLSYIQRMISNVILWIDRNVVSRRRWRAGCRGRLSIESKTRLRSVAFANAVG